MRYAASNEDQNFILSKSDQLLIGCGGEGSAISLPVDFHTGMTNPCSTFRNDRLLATEFFHVVHLEVFGLGTAPRP